MSFAEFNAMMLLTDAFGGFGGISQFNRDFLRALDRSEAVTRTFAFPRIIKQTITEEMPESVVYMRAAAQGKLRYAGQLMRGLYQCPGIDLIICGHIRLLPLAAAAAALKKARLALIIHGIEAWQPHNALSRKIASRVDAVIAVSHLSAERFQQWAGVAANRIFVLGNCVDLNRFKPLPADTALAARYGLGRHRVIMTLGRLSESERYKGVDEVLDLIPALVKEVPDLKYLVVGDGDDRARLEEKANRLGVSRHVVFVPGIAEAEKVAHYNLADAFVMPSSGEGFGIVLLEAAACGLAVVGSAVDGSREALLGGALGTLVDPRDPAAIRQAILDSLKAKVTKVVPPGIGNFSVPAFERKLKSWLESQAASSTALAA